ncbi:MAG: rod shape-determining protein RodA, partial [Alphaproteobacteria bacterium]|nr:rod shape-determining protein RodA [Alphaproteobacteria bacterium]
MRRGGAFRRPEMLLREKLWHVSWSFILLLRMVAGIGFLMLVSAANGNADPWASRQMVRFGVGVGVMLVVGLVDIRIWMKHAYALYVIAAILLVLVELRGTIGMGAQRWIDLGFVQLQPSEVMKISLVLALARYFHGANLQEVGRPVFLIVPLLMVLAPAVLGLKQPDLGTAMMLILSSGGIFWLAGVRLWKFALVFSASVAAIPVAWNFLREYQKQRVLTFLNPENDPLGSGYHIMQSKIALGSGGLFGKGFMLGTQSHLNF